MNFDMIQNDITNMTISKESLLDKFTSKLTLSAFPTPEKYTGTIFHYTSSNNINPILFNEDTVVLWASRYDCLNDISEGTLPQIRFAEVCEELRRSEQISEEFYNLIHQINPTKTDLTFITTDHCIRPFRGEYDTYVTSFSEAYDSLAMWNYYSKGSRYEGINIGIRTQMLLDSLEMNGHIEGKIKVCAFKIIYDAIQQREIISTFIEELFSKYEPGDESSVRYHISTMLSSLKMRFKNKCFEHENEVRVIIHVFKKYKEEVPVKYRTFAGYFIPYIELKFDKGAVCQLTTGPMVGTEQQKQLQQSVIHEMLENHDYYITEKSSEIPVRY